MSPCKKLNSMPCLFGKKTFFELSHYLVASILGTVAHYLVLFGLVQFFSLGTVIASTCGAVTGAVIIYFLNYYLVFKSDRRHREAVVRFFLVACSGVILNGLILKFLVSVCDWHYLGLQLMTTAIVFGSNFVLNRSWTFAARRALPCQKPD